ncbi:hypothetical protein V8G54_007463 [Vigna mungo]|uniref:Uncharacterized protein n=1 Tax=Vigna mungo TaxID=3915 RepID=A0AAQ3P147_VIGMU
MKTRNRRKKQCLSYFLLFFQSISDGIGNLKTNQQFVLVEMLHLMFKCLEHDCSQRRRMYVGKQEKMSLFFCNFRVLGWNSIPGITLLKYNKMEVLMTLKLKMGNK